MPREVPGVHCVGTGHGTTNREGTVGQDAADGTVVQQAERPGSGPGGQRGRVAASEVPAGLPLPPAPHIGQVGLMRGMRELRTIFERIRDDVGPVALVRLGPDWLTPPFVVVSSPDGARRVLGGRDPAWDKVALPQDEARDGLGVSTFTMTNRAWGARRRTVQPAFTPQHVRAFGGHMADASETIAHRWTTSDGHVDLDEEMRRLTLRIIGRTMFGMPLDDDAEALAPDVEQVLRYISRRTLNPLRAPGWVPSSPRGRRNRARRRLQDECRQALEQHRHHAVDGQASLVELLSGTCDPETGVPLDDRAIVDELVTFLIAGHDTTATALTAAAWLLGRHPRIQDEVAAEVAACGSETLGVDDLADLPLTGRVLKEAMRLYPSAATVVRGAVTDTAVDGYHVPAGATALVGIWAIHRDPQLWPDPTRFDPDRFLPAHERARDRWTYLPFGGGPRSCIGERFAMLEATIGLATLVRRFHIETSGATLPVTVPFTLTADGPIHATVTPR